MNPPSAMTAVYSLIGLLVNWLLIVFLWWPYMIDAFRQDLYELRAELLQVTAQQGISFSDPLYILLCNRIESMIKWAPRLTVTHLILAYFSAPSFRSLLKDPLDLPPADARSMMSARNIEKFIAINHWLLLRAFFQALHVPAVLFPFGRVAWGLSTPASQSTEKIKNAIAVLERHNLLDPVRLLVREAVEYKAMGKPA